MSAILILEHTHGDSPRLYAATSHVCHLALVLYGWAKAHTDAGWHVTAHPGALIATVRLDDGHVAHKHLDVEWPAERLRHMAAAAGLDPRWTAETGPQPLLDVRGAAERRVGR